MITKEMQGGFAIGGAVFAVFAFGVLICVRLTGLPVPATSSDEGARAAVG